jgi:hypothetical protein
VDLLDELTHTCGNSHTMEYHIYGVGTAFVSSDQTVVGSNLRLR